MGKKKPRISTEEKRRLILAYYDSGETVKDFCNKHLLCRASFDRWLKAYHGQGTSGLISPTEKACEKIAPCCSDDQMMTKCSPNAHQMMIAGLKKV